MSAILGWRGKKEDKRDLLSETTDGARLKDLDGDERQNLLFDCIRAGNIEAVNNVLALYGDLSSSKMYGYEGSNIKNDIRVKDGEKKIERCYFYTGIEKDGFFFPQHVAAESGHKHMIKLFIEKYLSDLDEVDYREMKAEDKCNGDNIHAFYEKKGMLYESHERYDGESQIKRDKVVPPKNGEITFATVDIRMGSGVLYLKPEGYESTEKVLYRGTFKDNKYHGQGTLYWPSNHKDPELEKVEKKNNISAGVNIIRGIDFNQADKLEHKESPNADPKLKYVGRFKDGLEHGRGMLFDSRGNKVYHGTFREGKKDGRGDLFEEVDGAWTRTYKGEFTQDKQHGFGVAYYAEGHVFVGRFEDNVKAGVGVYSYPNGDRFEGMFFNNQPDGKGSYYKPQEDGGEAGTHSLWQAGRQVKELESPFVPEKVDMPDPDGENAVLSAILRSSDAELLQDKVGEENGENDNDNNNNVEEGNRKKTEAELLNEDVSHIISLETAEADEKEKREKEKQNIMCGPAWKSELGRAVRFSGKIAKKMTMEPVQEVGEGGAEEGENQKGGKMNLNKSEDKSEKFGVRNRRTSLVSAARTTNLKMPEHVKPSLSKAKSTGPDNEDDEEEDEEHEQNEMDDVIGSHFIDCAPLFTAYVYVCSASKVFEGRWAMGQGSLEEVNIYGENGASVPPRDFDAVYHLVMDAVDEYNDNWDSYYKVQREREESEKAQDGADLGLSTADIERKKQQASVSQRSKLFQTDAEKRQELKRKQRAELAAKKGQVALNRDKLLELKDSTFQKLKNSLVMASYTRKISVTESKSKNSSSNSNLFVTKTQRHSSVSYTPQQKNDNLNNLINLNNTTMNLNGNNANGANVGPVRRNSDLGLHGGGSGSGKRSAGNILLYDEAEDKELQQHRLEASTRGSKYHRHANATTMKSFMTKEAKEPKESKESDRDRDRVRVRDDYDNREMLYNNDGDSILGDKFSDRGRRGSGGEEGGGGRRGSAEQYGNKQTVSDQANVTLSPYDEPLIENEFASELLYLIQMAKDSM